MKQIAPISARIGSGLAVETCGLLCLIVLAQQCVAQGSVTASLVVPNADERRPGPIRQDGPFTFGSHYLLQVYDASQFFPLSQGGSITGISFRQDEGRGGFDVTYSTVNIQLATFPQPVTTLLGSDNPNSYKDSAIVFSHSNVRLTGEGSTSLSVPSPFELRFTFDKAFNYNPANGNLLVYISLGAITAGTAYLDADDSRPNVSHPAGYSVTGPSLPPPFNTVPGPEVLVAQFEYNAVPEPRSVAIVSMGLLLLLNRYEPRRHAARI